MTGFEQITRPFSWLSIFNPLASILARKAATETSATVTVHSSPTPALQLQLTDNGIKLPCKIDATCYQEMLALVQQICPANGSALVLDLSSVEQLELTGIFALHCIALLMRGEIIPDPEYGWSAMRTAAERNLAAGRQSNLTLLNPSIHIEAMLRANHFDRVLIIESQSI